MRTLFKRFCGQMKKLRAQLFAAYLCLLVLFLAMMLAALLVIRGLVTDQIGASRQDVLRQIAERASTIKTSGITLLHSYAYEIDTQHCLDGALSAARRAAVTDYLDAQKQRYDAVFTDFDSEVLLLGENGYEYSTSAGTDFAAVKRSLWYRSLLQELESRPQEDVQFSRTFQNDFFADRQGCWFAAGSVLRGANGRTGVLLVLMGEDVLQNVYAPALAQGGEIYIYDQNGFIVSHPNKKMLGKQFIDVDNMRALYGENSYSVVRKLGQSYLLSTYLDEQTGWTIVEEIPTRAIFGALTKVYVVLGVLAGLAVLSTLAVAVYMSLHISRPLTELSDAMDAFGSRDFTPVPVNTGTEEIDHLRESFNHMALELFHLMDAVEARERQKRTLEMNFLRAQINPHFLYNMLFSIRCTVEMGKNEQAAKMLAAFTDLLKSTLMVKETVIPLADEFESTRKYLVVQKLRYGEKVQFEMDLDPDSAACLVPPLILQPLVENAIFHGIEAKDGPGLVVVSSAQSGGDLVLTVCDDGAGMDGETLQRARAKCQSPEVGDGGSIGLANVHNRIWLNYGPQYGVTIESTPGIGTTVTIRMPAVRRKGEEQLECPDR